MKRSVSHWTAFAKFAPGIRNSARISGSLTTSTRRGWLRKRKKRSPFISSKPSGIKAPENQSPKENSRPAPSQPFRKALLWFPRAKSQERNHLDPEIREEGYGWNDGNDGEIPVVRILSVLYNTWMIDQDRNLPQHRPRVRSQVYQRKQKVFKCSVHNSRRTFCSCVLTLNVVHFSRPWLMSYLLFD